MLFYKRFYIWYNDLQKKWIVQQGGVILGGYQTLAGSKQSITKKWAKL